MTGHGLQAKICFEDIFLARRIKFNSLRAEIIPTANLNLKQ